MLRIPTGTYSMRGDPVPVDSFWVDEYEVSNADYQRFVDDGGYAESGSVERPFRLVGRGVRRREDGGRARRPDGSAGASRLGAGTPRLACRAAAGAGRELVRGGALLRLGGQVAPHLLPLETGRRR